MGGAGRGSVRRFSPRRRSQGRHCRIRHPRLRDRKRNGHRAWRLMALRAFRGHRNGPAADERTRKRVLYQMGVSAGTTSWTRPSSPIRTSTNTFGITLFSGGMAAGFGYYRAFAQDARDNAALFAQAKITCPVLAVGGDHAFRDATLKNMQNVCTDVRGVMVENCGHFVNEEKTSGAVPAPHGLFRGTVTLYIRADVTKIVCLRLFLIHRFDTEE